MNKRSAMLVAAGLVLSLLVAGMAVVSGFTGPEASASGSRVSTDEIQRREPKVRTITETITVHRDAKPSGDGAAPAPVVITGGPTAAPTTSFDDDGFEDEDHGDEDHGDEDHDAEDDQDDHEDEDHEDD